MQSDTITGSRRHNEFVVKGPGLGARHQALLDQGVIAGLRLDSLDAERTDQLLLCTTELANRDAIDRLMQGLTA